MFGLFGKKKEPEQTVLLGSQIYTLHPYTAGLQTIKDGDKEYVYIEFGISSDIKDAFRIMIEESGKSGGKTMATDINGSVVIADYSMAPEEIEGIYRKGYKTLADAYSHLHEDVAKMRGLTWRPTPPEPPASEKTPVKNAWTQRTSSATDKNTDFSKEGRSRTP